MTGEQWYNVIRLALILAFGAFILYGVYRVATRDDRHRSEDSE